MTRTIRIEVKNKAELEAVKRGLAQPDVMAFVKLVGLLEPFSDRARGRILNFVADSLDERDASV